MSENLTPVPLEETPIPELDVETVLEETAQDTQQPQPLQELDLNELLTQDMPSQPEAPKPEAPKPEAPKPEPVKAEAVEPPKPEKKKPRHTKPFRKRLSLGVRIPMQLLSFILCLALIVTLLVGVLMLDLRTMMSGDSFKQLLPEVLPLFLGGQQQEPQQAPYRAQPAGKMARSGGYVFPSGVELPEGTYSPDVELPGGTLPPDIQIPGGTLPPDIQIPGDIQPPTDFTDPDSLSQWIFDTAKDILGEEAEISKESVDAFVQESTLTDFLADKMSGYTQDVINGTADTLITTDEIMNLVQENKEVINKNFGVEITDEHMEQIQVNVDKVVEEGNLNEKIHETVQQITKSEEPVVAGMSIAQLLDVFRQLTSDSVVMTVLIVIAVMVLLLLLLNFYNIPAGMTWTAFACILSGGLLSLPVILVQNMPDLMTTLGLAQLQSVANVLVGVMAPLHYGLLALGGTLLLVSIIWRIIRIFVEKKRFAPAV